MIGKYEGLPEATEYSLFPPADRVRAWTADKERTKKRLREVFPSLTFAITDISLGPTAVAIPILGEAGEGGRGIYASPPSRRRHDEIEAALNCVVVD